MKKSVIFILLILSLNAFSQEKEENVFEGKKTIFTIQLVPFSLGVEQFITKKTTLKFDFGGELLIVRFINDYYYYQQKYTKLYITPFFNLEPRFYTNIRSKTVKNKQQNSFYGDFLALKIKTGYNTFREQWYLQTGPMLGFQRKIGSNSFFAFSIGTGTTIIDDEINFGIIGEVRFGFILN